MKNFGKIMALFAAVFMFSSIILSCSSDSGSDNGDDSETATTEDTLLEKQIALYNSLLGTYEDLENDGEHLIKKLVLSSNSITVDDKTYSFNPRTGFDTKILGADETCMVFTLGTTRYFLETSVSSLSSADISFGNYSTNKVSDMKRVTSSSGGGSGEATTLNGTYSFESATGSQTNGSITLSDGTWTYNGSKTNVAAKNGTYTVDGSKVTVNWTAQADVSETFTVTDNGDGFVKWVLDGYNNSTLFSMLFGVAGQTELTFKKSE